MLILGLCGGSGSGKGTVCQIFKKYGVYSIDTDAVYHELTNHESLCLTELRSTFGDGIISNGVLNRKELSKIVFFGKDSDLKRQKLNEITHKHILKRTKELLHNFEQQGAKAVLIDAPLLFESNFDKLCTFIICVIADKNIRVMRILKRDNITEESAIMRVNSQISDSELIKRSNFIIDNSGDIDNLEEQVKSIVQTLFDF